MIHGLWVIKKQGECLFERYFGATKQAPNISNLLSAIHTFSDSMTGESIRSITLENILFRYKVSRNIIFVLSTDREDDVTETLDGLEIKFWTEFKQPITEIDTNKLENFAKEADELIKEYERKKEIEELDDKLRALERELV
ncbi:MAG: hypothetical protein KIH08_02035 [Candidatus Freyarchaeota archaeon]|nr:hypothetical protein [Candidatus Jordarchaeia archaeon]MBS7268264.1 hypothetical protein [Candidatus Jordarchaeia archaeon]MBS7281080.1 hypothetical protein [Candidatus Jordarchaeia archaeon]